MLILSKRVYNMYLLKTESDETEDRSGPQQQGELVAEQLLQEVDVPS